MIKIKYKNKKEIDEILQKYSDHAIVEIRDTIDDRFIILKHKAEIEQELMKEELNKLKEEFFEKLMLDEDVTDVKEKIKKLKEKFKVEEI